MDDYYVYVYIDPRNFEEFYYGKGRGSRKDAHLQDASDSAKASRIRDIRREGVEPLIRVIARGLTEDEALLVEKTLLWKLGRLTTNIATGHFAEKFRPPNTLHKELSGFDYERGIYYYNVGEGSHRNWDDYMRLGFISAGQGRWRNSILAFRTGDVFVAYLKRRGFVGVGIVKTKARMVRDVLIGNEPLLSLPLTASLGDNSKDPEMSEYVCLVDWVAKVPRTEAKWRTVPRLFTTQHIRASLDGQPDTIDFVEEAFGLSLRDLAT